MKMKNINEEVKRFWAINRYAEKYIIEQEAPIPPLPGEIFLTYLQKVDL